MASFWDRYATDPAFADAVDEEARAVAESTRWVIRGPGDFLGQERPCEACGTLVAACLENDRRGDPDTWTLGIWERHGGGTRHTGRRCDWLAAHPGAEAAA